MKKLLPLLLVFSIACAGSFQKDAFNTLGSAKAAYTSASAARDAYCIPKTPKPQICTDSFRPLSEAYAAIKESGELLAVYIDTKSADAKTKLQAFLPQVAAFGIKLIALEGSFK